MDVQDVILTLALMLAAGLVAEPLAALLRLPRMLLLVLAGTILGPSVLGWIDLELDSTAVQVLLTLGVSFILFYGGLELSARILSRVAVGLGLLVVPGVVVTALLVGGVAALVFDLPFEMGLLIGAVLAPTDPAILIPLFERIRIRPKVSQTIIAESALNDPTGAVLALTFLGVVASREGLEIGAPVREFVVELAISIGIGIVLGVLLALVVSSHRFGVWRESSVIAALVVVAAGYFTVDYAGGSGYLGAFIAGLIVGNMRELRLGMHADHELELRVVVRQISEVMVIFFF
jgi:NhaP-type Na+/H+ or K+/H+ antiporter